MAAIINLKIPSRMEFLGVPDAVLMEVGSDLDCESRCLEELGTAVIEACTNAMEHGNHLDESVIIEVAITVNETQISVTVLDTGPGFDHESWQPSDDLMRLVTNGSGSVTGSKTRPRSPNSVS